MIGIECSTIIEQARKIVEANGYSDKITLIKSKCEDIESLEALAGVEKVRKWRSRPSCQTRDRSGELNVMRYSL